MGRAFVGEGGKSQQWAAVIAGQQDCASRHLAAHLKAVKTADSRLCVFFRHERKPFDNESHGEELGMKFHRFETWICSFPAEGLWENYSTSGEF